MDSEFKQCLDYVFHHEGGFVNDSLDTGGATAFGVSLRFLKGIDLADADINGDGHVDEADIRALNPQTAESFYRKYFYEHYKLKNIKDLETRKRAFGFFVNMRGKTAAKILQRACNKYGELNIQESFLKEDGIAGSRTFLVINSVGNKGLFLNLIRYEASSVYLSIVKNNPEQVRFLNGWLNRALD